MLTRSLVGRWGWVAWALTAGGLAASGCGGSSDEKPPGTSVGNTGNTANQPGQGGSAGRGGSTGKGGSGGTSDGGMSGDMGTAATGDTGTGGQAEVDPLAPIVEITSPDATSNPNSEAVIVTGEVDVVCEAKRSPEKGSKALESSTVVIEMLDAEENVVDTVMPTEGPTGVFTARFITTKVADNGVIGFRCSAGDKSSPVRTGTTTMETFIDHGPAVEFSEPSDDDQAIALGSLKITFTVKEQRVASGDKGARIGDVSLTVRDVLIDNVDEADGEYSATVNLKDAVLFPNVPNGSVPIVVEAGNRRLSTPAVRQEIRRVIVDGAGPTLTVTSPVEPFVIGGKVTLQFTATDDQAGVDPESVEVFLNSDEYRYAPGPDWTHFGNEYTFSFDATQIQGSQTQATIAVAATDMVGNPSPDKSIGVYLDNQPPIVDLDPPPVREGDSAGKCTIAFDPVGPSAANDLDVVYQVKKFRALVADLTNDAMGTDHLRYAGPNLDSVVIRLQPHPEQGLLFDKDKDGVCDELLTEDTESGADLKSRNLFGIQQKGNPFYGPVGVDTLSAEFPMPSSCTYGTDSTPVPLCPPTNGDDMFRVIPWDVTGTIPMIFGLKPDELACTGSEWEIGQFVEEGWICMAARAEDNVGNVGVSRPLRLCFDDGEDPPPPCTGSNAEDPPSCTIDCELPIAYPDHVLFVRH